MAKAQARVGTEERQAFSRRKGVCLEGCDELNVQRGKLGLGVRWLLPGQLLLEGTGNVSLPQAGAAECPRAG